MEKYIMVTFPEIQDFMEHERWGECIFCQAIEGHECPDSTYMVPQSLYEEVIGGINIKEIREHIGEIFMVEGQKAVLVGYASDIPDTPDKDCIVGFDSDTGWEGFDGSDTILYGKTFQSYWYIPWEELKESRSE